MTADGRRLPKYARVAAVVRRQVADGTLRPGQPAPSGAALSRATGYSTLTCRRALRLLLEDGVLIRGPSRNARPRVAGGPQPPAERDLAAAARALSAGLAARRRASGLTQPELARRAGVSVTTVGHAETGRLWQSRRFWERADAALNAGGALLRLHDGYRAAGAAGTPAEGDPVPGGQVPADEPWPPAGCQVADRGQAMPACVTIVWGDGTVTTVRPPEPPEMPPPGTGPPEASVSEASVPEASVPKASVSEASPGGAHAG